MPAYFMLWKILKYSKEKKLFLYFSFFMVKISHFNEISFTDWIKSYILLSKALFYNSMIDDAINLLRNLLDVFACIPIEDFKYLSEIYRINNISLTNMFVNFDSSLKFFSKYHVYDKSKGLFLMLSNLRKKINPNEKIFFSKNYLNLLNEKTPETNISDANSFDENNKKAESKRKSCNTANFSNSEKNLEIKKEDSFENLENWNKKNHLSNNIRKNETSKSIESDEKDLENSFEKNIIRINEEKKTFKNDNNLEKSDFNKKRTSKFKISSINSSGKKQDSKTSLNKVNSEENSKNNFPISSNSSNIKDIKCDDFRKLEKFIDDKINTITIPTDSPCKN